MTTQSELGNSAGTMVARDGSKTRFGDNSSLLMSGALFSATELASTPFYDSSTKQFRTLVVIMFSTAVLSGVYGTCFTLALCVGYLENEPAIHAERARLEPDKFANVSPDELKAELSYLGTRLRAVVMFLDTPQRIAWLCYDTPFYWGFMYLLLYMNTVPLNLISSLHTQWFLPKREAY